MNIKNPNPKADWKIGDSAYVFTHYNGLMPGHITDITNDTFTVESPFFKFEHLRADELFQSPEDACAATETASNRLTEQYKNEIQDVKDLLQFALRIPVAPCEEYTDESAIKAFKQKAKELLGIEL